MLLIRSFPYALTCLSPHLLMHLSARLFFLSLIYFFFLPLIISSITLSAHPIALFSKFLQTSLVILPCPLPCPFVQSLALPVPLTFPSLVAFPRSSTHSSACLTTSKGGRMKLIDGAFFGFTDPSG